MSETGADPALSPGSRYQRLLGGSLAGLDPALARRISELLALTDFGAEAFERTKLEEVASLILLVGLGETGARWGVLLVPDDEGVLRPAGRRGAAGERCDRLRGEVPGRLPRRVVLGADDEDGDDGRAAPFRRLIRESGAASATLLRTREGLRGVLLLGEPHADLGTSRSDFLEAFAGSAGAALDRCRRGEELGAANRRLSLHVYQLRSLMDLSQGLHRARDEAAVWDLLLHGAMGHVLASRAAVASGGRVLAARGPRRPGEDWSVLARAADLARGEGARPAEELPEPGIARELAAHRIGWIVPFAAGAVRGALFLGRAGFGRGLSSADRAFLTSLAEQAAAAVESLRLTRAAIEKEKELVVARSIQSRLLPAEPPNLPGWDIWGINIPCLAVGGDYFDYLTIESGVLVTVADVSGKGAGPALIMASVQASLRAFVRHGHTRLDSAATELNRLLHRNTEDSRYMTALLASLDPASGRLDYLNAGHAPPVLVRRGGSVERLDRGSTVLGLFPEITTEVATCRLERGDTLALFTDGLSETEDPAGDLFDEARIVEALAEARRLDARTICGDLLSRARAFAGSNSLRDDLTLMVVKCDG